MPVFGPDLTRAKRAVMEQVPVTKKLSIVLDGETTLDWDLAFSEGGTLKVEDLAPGDNPPWVQLSFCQCPECPLDQAKHSTCPVAEVLARYARTLADRTSFEKVTVHIISEDSRHIVLREVALQNAVSELVRLAVFQTGCPIGRMVKPTMTDIPPFPSNREILAALAAYFAEHPNPEKSKTADGYDDSAVEMGHGEFMNALHSILGCLTKRFEHAGDGDVYLNAVVILHSLAVLFSISAPELINKAMNKLNADRIS